MVNSEGSPGTKEPRTEEAAASRKREHIQYELQEHSRTGDHEANCRVFRQDEGN
jgi:hypothetical protein